jgi:hypothetical protein
MITFSGTNGSLFYRTCNRKLHFGRILIIFGLKYDISDLYCAHRDLRVRAYVTLIRARALACILPDFIFSLKKRKMKKQKKDILSYEWVRSNSGSIKK